MTTTETQVDTTSSVSVQTIGIKMDSTTVLQEKPSKGVTMRLMVAIFAAVMGSFQFGFNTGVINVPGTVIQEFMNETQYNRTGSYMEAGTLTIIWSTAVAIFAVGGMVGGLCAGAWADKFGRKKGMIFNTIFGIAAGALFGFSKIAGSYEMIIIARIVVGFHCGLYTGLSPMYLSEVAPQRLRGAFGVVNQLGVTIALLLSQVIGLPIALGTTDGWPLLLALTAVPAVIQLILLPCCPESPRYLLLTLNKEIEAIKALEILRGTTDVQYELDEMKSEQKDEQSETKVSVPKLLCSTSLRLPLAISLVMHLSQQFGGINAVFYYSTPLFKSAGLDEQAATYATLGVGAIMVVMTLVSIPLMDHAGRRTLHLLGLSGQFIFSILITVTLSLLHLVPWFSYVSVASALIFVMFFAIGPGSIPWLIVNELFAQGARSSAVSVSVLVNWTCNFIVGLAYPQLQTAAGEFSFIPFTVMLALFILFLFAYLPETKNKTFEEIQELFRKKNSRAPADDPASEKSYGSGGYTTESNTNLVRYSKDPSNGL